MNTTINHIPKKWNKDNFANWYVNHIKANHLLTEDYNLLRQ